MKKKALGIVLSGMLILSLAACGGTKEAKESGGGENQTSAETVKEEKAETEESKVETEEPKAETEEPKAETEEPKAETEEPKTEIEEPVFEKTVVCEQDGITVTMTDFKENALYYAVKNETEKKIFVDPLKIEVNGSVIRDFLNDSKEYYLGAIAFGEKVAPGEEIEISKNLFELTERGITAEEMGVVFGIVEVKGDRPPEIEYNEILTTDMIAVKIPKQEATETAQDSGSKTADGSKNEFGVTESQMELLNELVSEAVKTEYLEPHGISVADFKWPEVLEAEQGQSVVWKSIEEVGNQVRVALAAASTDSLKDDLEATYLEDGSADYDLANAIYHSFYLKWMVDENIDAVSFSQKVNSIYDINKGTPLGQFLIENVTIS